MNKIYEVWIGWRENNEDCYLRTTDIEKAKEMAKYHDARSTNEDKKRGLFVEIRIPINEYDYNIIEF